MIEIIQAPLDTKINGIKLFLGGGISNCPNWQDDISNRIKNSENLKKFNGYLNLIVYNPRCKTLPEEVPQVIWEFNNLEKSDIICFWFSRGSVNPITLFEYGSHFKNKKKTIIVGCDPLYERKTNVIIQTKLAMPNLKVILDFDEFYNDIETSILTKRKKI
jgi:hypothetical protein